MPNEPIIATEMVELFQSSRRIEGNLEVYSLFEHTSRTRMSVTYTTDGRRLSNGRLEFPETPEHLWQESFKRLMALHFRNAALEEASKVN